MNQFLKNVFLCIILFVFFHCTKSPQECLKVSDCAAGSVCVENLCKKLCGGDNDCGGNARCNTTKICETVTRAECDGDDKCVSPGPCEVATGAVCRGGTCFYPTKKPQGAKCGDTSQCIETGSCNNSGVCEANATICGQVPESKCDESNQNIVSVIGFCDNGSCNDQDKLSVTACVDCTQNKGVCLARCSGVNCDNPTNDCEIHRCDTADGQCKPFGIKPEHSICNYSGTNGTSDGFCLPASDKKSTQCVQCVTNADCGNPPDHIDCRKKNECKLTTHTCDYSALPNDITTCLGTTGTCFDGKCNLKPTSCSDCCVVGSQTYKLGESHPQNSCLECKTGSGGAEWQIDTSNTCTDNKECTIDSCSAQGTPPQGVCVGAPDSTKAGLTCEAGSTRAKICLNGNCINKCALCIETTDCLLLNLASSSDEIAKDLPPTCYKCSNDGPPPVNDVDCSVPGKIDDPNCCL